MSVLERAPKPGALFTALPVKQPPEAHPRSPRERLERLLEEAELNWMWTKKLDAVGRKRHEWPLGEQSRLGGAVAGAVLVVLVGVWLLGAGALVYLAAKALAASP